MLAPEGAGHELVLQGILDRGPFEVESLLPVVPLVQVRELIHLLVVKPLLIQVVEVPVAGHHQRLLRGYPLIQINVPVLCVRDDVHLLRASVVDRARQVHRQQVVRPYPAYPADVAIT